MHKTFAFCRNKLCSFKYATKKREEEETLEIFRGMLFVDENYTSHRTGFHGVREREENSFQVSK